MLLVMCFGIYESIKLNLGHAWILKPHALGKLITLFIILGIKQNLSYAWFLEPHTLGKLILNEISPEY